MCARGNASPFINSKLKAMITNINTGICHSRAQQGQPAFFVNWQVNGAQHYRFFALRFAAENFYQSLLKQQL